MTYARAGGDPRRYVLDWVFCSRRCQDIFHQMCDNWQRAKEGRIGTTEVAMIDPSDVELAAMRQCLKTFGEAAGEIGFAKPLGDYAEAEALRVIGVTRRYHRDWRDISIRFTCGRTTAWRHWQKALETVAGRLNGQAGTSYQQVI